MNVLYVCADRGIPVLGNKGASVHVRSVTAAMQALGHEVTLAARRFDDGNSPPQITRIERLPSEPDRAADLLQALMREQDVEVVIERYSLDSGAARAAATRCGLELTLEVNAPLVREATRFRGLQDPGAAERERSVLRAADRIQVVSPALASWARAQAPEVPVAHIPNGADVAPIAAAAPADLEGARGRTVVGLVGSMKPWHGADDLLEAFHHVHAAHPGAVLAFIGSGPLEEGLARDARRLDLEDRVIFTGHVPHARVPSLLRRLDVGVAPYRPVDDFYFHPLKVVEYLAAGKPVIYSDQGDLRSLVGPAGLDYRPGSVGELAERLSAVLGDPVLRARLGRHAAERGAGLDWSVIAGRVLAFAAGDASAPGSSTAHTPHNAMAGS